MRFTGTKEIKEHVVRVLQGKASELRGRRALDFPAGNGVTSTALHNMGADVVAVDLFPELFRAQGDGIEVLRGDLSLTFPLKDEEVEFAVCQEGIEHVGNQDHVMREFARILKPGGRLLVTTPNYSNIKSKLSYLFCESEAFGRIMPPNEHETVWIAPKAQNATDDGKRIYFGHCFLTGFFRLRLFAKMAGLKLVKVHDSRVNTTSLLWLPLLYPFILLSSWRTMRRFARKTGLKPLARDLFRWMVSPKLLLENHLMLEFEKIPLDGGATTSFTVDKGDLASFTT